MRITSDVGDPRGGVTARVHVRALERVDARPGKDGVPSGVATHEQIAGDIEQAVGANDGAREVEQGEERRDREGVDEPGARRIPGGAHRHTETRREEQLLEGNHGDDEAILGGVIVERRIRDEPEEVVIDRCGSKSVSAAATSQIVL